MAIFYDKEQLPGFKNAVITIGTFDGVHRGHRKILQEVVKHAKKIDGESIVITFDPHPRKLLFPDQSLRLLTPLEEKLELITETGIQHIVVAPFTKEFSQLTAKEYVANFLVRYFHPSAIVIGYDHHFGNDRSGNITLLRSLENEHSFEVIEIPAQLIEEAAVSSTKIRNALLEGKVEEAFRMEGRHYSLRGTVIEGKKLGRTLGYPTANILPSDPDQLIPALGIYAVRVAYGEKEYGGMLSIGHNPTVTDEKKVHIEVNIFGFDSEIYGDEIVVSFIAFLREEEKFDSLEALKEQLARDEEQSRYILSI